MCFLLSSISRSFITIISFFLSCNILIRIMTIITIIIVIIDSPVMRIIKKISTLSPGCVPALLVCNSSEISGKEIMNIMRSIRIKKDLFILYSTSLRSQSPVLYDNVILLYYHFLRSLSYLALASACFINC